LGEISTKSKPTSSAIKSAFCGDTTPSFSPSAPINRISGLWIPSFTLGPVSREGGALCGLRAIALFLY